MSKLTKYKFSDLYEMSSGISSSKEQAGHGSPFISFSTVFNNYFLPEELPDLMDTSLKEQEIFSVKKDDVFITRTSETVDALAMSCVAVKDYTKATFSGFVKRLRPKTTGIVYSKYIAFFLRSKYFRKVLDCNTIMTLRASFNEDMFSFLYLYLPDYEEQVRIGDLLYKMEIKIRTNNKINDNLEQQLMLLYRHIVLNDNLAAMAYDIYMHTFFSKKPNAKLKDILTEAEKSSIQVGEAKISNGKYPFFTSGSTILKWNEPFVDGRNCFLNTGGNADVKFYVGKAAYSTDTWSVSAKSEMSDYLYLMLFSIRPELDQKFFQGTGLKHLQKPLLKDRPIYVPEKMELEAFNRQVMPMFDIISENTRENQQLTSLRDWLLPMLMNGQATISD